MDEISWQKSASFHVKMFVNIRSEQNLFPRASDKKGKENCVGYYMERTKKHRIWFQAASEFKREENNYEQGHFLCKAISIKS